MKQGSPRSSGRAFALRLAPHFIQRLKERFPDRPWTEGALRRALEDADWYPAGGRAYYAILHIGTATAVSVVDVHDGILDLITIYRPRRAWDLRLSHARPWPFALVALAGSA